MTLLCLDLLLARIPLHPWFDYDSMPLLLRRQNKQSRSHGRGGQESEGKSSCFSSGYSDPIHGVQSSPDMAVDLGGFSFVESFPWTCFIGEVTWRRHWNGIQRNFPAFAGEPMICAVFIRFDAGPIGR
jgi:hypothetical protein